MAVLGLLLIAAVVMQVMLVQDAATQSGESGSAMECIEPDPRPDPPTGLVDDSYQEMRCHLACIEIVSQNEGVTIEVSAEYSAWPVIPDSVLERNCTIYQMVAECRRGCSAGKRCNQHCSSGCCEDCVMMDSDCPYVCNELLCQMGCEVFDHLEIIKSRTNAVPQDPAGPIDLIIPFDSDIAGLYIMNPEAAIPKTNEDNTTEQFPTGFVIVVTQFTGTFYRTAFWMASFEGMLNLEPWACEEIDISLVAVNKFGQTENLAATARTVEVYGEHPPTSPTNPELFIKYEADTRPGYWKHAIVTISWYKPWKGFELLLEYHVTFLLLNIEEQPNCEPRNKTFTLDKAHNSQKTSRAYVRVDEFEK